MLSKSVCKVSPDNRYYFYGMLLVAAAAVIRLFLNLFTGISILPVLLMMASLVLMYLAQQNKVPLWSAFIPVILYPIFALRISFLVGFFGMIGGILAVLALMVPMNIPLDLKALKELPFKADQNCIIAAALLVLCALLFLLVEVVNAIRYHYTPSFFGIITTIAYLLGVAAALLGTEPDHEAADEIKAAQAEKEEAAKDAPSQNSSASYETISDEEGYCGLVKHVLLLVFTFGIWYFIWIYRVTKYLNKTENMSQQSPVSQLLLCMFIPFYQIYWYYKNAQRLDKLANDRGVDSDLSMLCLILSIVAAIVAAIIMQDKINTIIENKNRIAAPKVTREPEAQPAASAADEIKKYKDLLDSGAITQEEFDMKKKQLLGL